MKLSEQFKFDNDYNEWLGESCNYFLRIFFLSLERPFGFSLEHTSAREMNEV